MQPGVRQTGPFLDVIVLETKEKSLSAHRRARVRRQTFFLARAHTYTHAHTQSHVRQSHEITRADQDDMPVGVLMKDA